MNIKMIYGKFIWLLTKIIGIDATKKFDTKIRFHRSLNLASPQSLADKVTYIELHDQSLLAMNCTDKYKVRDYVKEKGLSKILVPIVGSVWNNVDDIDFSELPNSFVLKATHGCKMNYLVPDKAAMDIEKCRKEMTRWLSTTYGAYSLEPHYINIPHRIYAEIFLDDTDKMIDYKFHCLNGIPRFVLVCSNRKTNGDNSMSLILDLFDMEWNPIYELVSSKNEVPGDGKIPKPKYLKQMINIAAILSKDFKFVRVDLYELGEKIYFGELTFSPACCVFPYFTESFNSEMGKLLKI